MLLNVWKCWKYQKNGKGMWWNVIKCHQKCDQMLDLKCDQMWLKMLENVIECHQMSKNVGKCDWNVRKRFPDIPPVDKPEVVLDESIPAEDVEMIAIK